MNVVNSSQSDVDMGSLAVPKLSDWTSAGDVIPVDEFRSLFKTFQTSAFRFETLPSYAVSHEDKHFGSYLRGEKSPPFIFEDWKNTIQTATSAGKVFEVVRVVPDPLTTYFKYELEWHYLEYRSAHQETRFLLPNKIGPDLLPASNKDFWLFDDSIAIAMIYDDSANISKRCKITDPVWLQNLRSWKTIAHESSISLESYLEIYNKN